MHYPQLLQSIIGRLQQLFCGYVVSWIIVNRVNVKLTCRLWSLQCTIGLTWAWIRVQL